MKRNRTRPSRTKSGMIEASNVESRMQLVNLSESLSTPPSKRKRWVISENRTVLYRGPSLRSTRDGPQYEMHCQCSSTH